MKRTTILILTLAAFVIMSLATGCSYFNTFYNVRKQFNEAERDYNSRQPAKPQAQPGSPPGQPGGAPPRPQQPQQPGAATDKYRKVIETASKLLEYYPKSRWIDDALLLMGISYYRLADYPRAERKFTELMTIFPNSKHVGDATIWKARTLLAQDKHAEATELLGKMSPELKQRQQRGQAELLLARTEFDAREWEQASTHFKIAADMLGGEERWEALYLYGVCRHELKAYAEAEQAFEQAARNSRDRRRAYDANIFVARTALALGDAERAEHVLTRLKNNSNFADLEAEIDLELAQLAVETGRLDEGIRIYELQAANPDGGESRGLAFYRLAKVYRTHRVDLALAKTLLDSVITVGATSEIADSARALQDELSRGLLALHHVEALQDSLDALRAARAALLEKGVSVPVVIPAADSTVTDSLARPDSVAIGSGVIDSISTRPDTSVADSARAAPDSTATIEDSTSTSAPRPATPASLMADSILKALQAEIKTDSASADSLHLAEPEAPETPPVSMPVKDEAAELTETDQSIADLERQLPLAYLRVAEFYQYSLAEPDSALAYYRRAGASPLNADVYWKANLFLGEAAARDSSRQEAAKQYFQNVISVPNVPLDAANRARQSLGMPLLELPVSLQVQAFRSAEVLAMSNQIPADSLVRLYDQIIAYDSTSAVAIQALFAQFYLYEHTLLNMDSAHAVGERLIALFPDSSFSKTLSKRLQPPDSLSIFLVSDEELYRKFEPKESVLETPTEGGWPPPEEALRGRRFE